MTGQLSEQPVDAGMAHAGGDHVVVVANRSLAPGMNLAPDQRTTRLLAAVAALIGLGQTTIVRPLPEGVVQSPGGPPPTAAVAVLVDFDQMAVADILLEGGFHGFQVGPCRPGAVDRVAEAHDDGALCQRPEERLRRVAVAAVEDRVR
jgi:hypothetical protein